MGVEGYPVIGYYNLAIFVNVIVAMIGSNIPRWSARSFAQQNDVVDERRSLSTIRSKEETGEQQQHSGRGCCYALRLWADVELMCFFLLIQLLINVMCIVYWAKLFDGDPDLSEMIVRSSNRNLGGSVHASDFTTEVEIEL